MSNTITIRVAMRDKTYYPCAFIEFSGRARVIQGIREPVIITTIDFGIISQLGNFKAQG